MNRQFVYSALFLLSSLNSVIILPSDPYFSFHAPTQLAGSPLEAFDQYMKAEMSGGPVEFTPLPAQRYSSDYQSSSSSSSSSSGGFSAASAMEIDQELDQSASLAVAATPPQAEQPSSLAKIVAIPPARKKQKISDDESQATALAQDESHEDEEEAKKSAESDSKKRKQPSEKTCPYTECGESLLPGAQYKQHMSIHEGLKDLDLEDNVKIPKGTFFCKDCGQFFLNKYQRNKHTNNKCAPTESRNSFTCPYSACARSFSTPSSCNNHLQSHEVLKSLGREANVKIPVNSSLCKECGRFINSGGEYTEHKRNKCNTVVKPTICDFSECRLNLGTYIAYLAHMKQHNRYKNPNFKCIPGFYYCLTCKNNIPRNISYRHKNSCGK